MVRHGGTWALDISGVGLSPSDFIGFFLKTRGIGSRSTRFPSDRDRGPGHAGLCRHGSVVGDLLRSTVATPRVLTLRVYLAVVCHCHTPRLQNPVTFFVVAARTLNRHDVQIHTSQGETTFTLV
jgi:hypothetical protein